MKNLKKDNQINKQYIDNNSRKTYENNFKSNVFYPTTTTTNNTANNNSNNSNNSNNVKFKTKREEVKYQRTNSNLFTPAFEDKSAGQRKISNLSGSLSKLPNKNANTKTNTSTTNLANNAFANSSMGYYRKEITHDNKLENNENLTAKERFQASYSSRTNFSSIGNRNNRVGNIKENKEAQNTTNKTTEKTNKKINQKNNIDPFKITFMDTRKIQHDGKDVKQIHYESLHSSKIFGDEYTKKITYINKEKLKGEYESIPIVKHFNWDNKNIKEVYNPLRVKRRTKIVSHQYSWKDSNSELLNMTANYNDYDNYSKENFKEKLKGSALDSENIMHARYRLVSENNINSSNSPNNPKISNNNVDKSIMRYNGKSFNRTRSVGMRSKANLLNGEEANNGNNFSSSNHNTSNTSNANAKTRKKQSFVSNIFCASNSTKNLLTKSNNTNSANTYGNFNSLNNYKITVEGEKFSTDEITKLFASKGIHLYNVKENINWTNGNSSGNISFKIRNNINNTNNNINTSNAEKDLQDKGLQLEKIKVSEVQSSSGKSDLYPLQAKWDDTNIQKYHITKENEKKSINAANSNKDFRIKTTLKADKSYYTYKNDKAISRVIKRK